MLRCGDVFRPQVGLCAEDMLGLFVGERGGRVEAVHFLHRYVTSYAEGFVLGIGGLEIVEVAIYVGRHNHVVSQPGRFDAAGCAAPGHNGGVRRHVTFQNLIPADNLPSFAVEELFDTCHAVALQAVFGRMPFVRFQAFRLDARLTFGTLRPAGTGSFVSADMYKPGREYFGDFRHYVFEELHGLFVADA